MVEADWLPAIIQELCRGNFDRLEVVQGKRQGEQVVLSSLVLRAWVDVGVVKEGQIVIAVAVGRAVTGVKGGEGQIILVALEVHCRAARPSFQVACPVVVDSVMENADRD